MRLPFLACLAFVCNAAHAGDPLAGVWTGSVGTAKIVACFNNEEAGSTSGSYYYERHKKPIQLSRKETQVHWTEEGDSGHWTLSPPLASTATGSWRHPETGKTLAISLSLAQPPGEEPSCASDAYNLALEVFPPLETGPVSDYVGRKYRTLRIADVPTIELIDPRTPGQKLVSRHLRNVLPRTKDDLKDYFEKRRVFLGRMGLAAQDETSVEISFWTDDYLTVRYFRWEAGQGVRGARSDYNTWDLQNGAEVSLWSWFRDNDPASTSLPPPLRRYLFKGVKEAPECEYYYGKGSYELMLTETGMTIAEHAFGSGCEQSFHVRFEKLGPFMTPQGKRALKRLIAGATKAR